MNSKIVLAQIDSVLGNIEKNIDRHCEYIEKAIDRKAFLVVFPELSLTGYVLRDLNYELAINPSKSQVLNPIKKLSKYINIICGGVEEGNNYGIYNSAFYFSKGEYVTSHKKVYLPTYGLFEEERYFSPGRELNPIDTEFGKIGILICEDFWHLTLPYILAKKGVMLIVGLSASPTRISPGENEFQQDKTNNEFHKVYAKLLSLYISWCNRVGYEEGMNFWGGSEIVSPIGNVIAKAPLFEKSLIEADLSLDFIKRSRIFSKHFVDDDIMFTFNELQKIIK